MAVIEVFADVGCPFTHVGLLRVAQARAARGRGDVLLRVRAWPLEVVNGKPLDPGFIAEEVDEIRPQIEGDLFSGFDSSQFPSSSIPALALAATAYQCSDDIGEQVSLELRDLLFERATDVSDPAVLEAMAKRLDLEFDSDAQAHNRDLVMADHAEGEARGVIGSPHFFTSGGGFFCPALDVSRDADGQLRVTADPEGFDQFLSDAFG